MNFRTHAILWRFSLEAAMRRSRRELAWFWKERLFGGGGWKPRRLRDGTRSGPLRKALETEMPVRRNLKGEWRLSQIFFIFSECNPLKCPDSEKLMKENESNFAFICSPLLSRSSPWGCAESGVRGPERWAIAGQAQGSRSRVAREARRPNAPSRTQSRFRAKVGDGDSSDEERR
jgi:hypothetical protein